MKAKLSEVKMMGHEINLVNMMNNNDMSEDDSDTETGKRSPNGIKENNLTHSSGEQVRVHSLLLRSRDHFVFERK